jgi:hypothetical protein
LPAIRIHADKEKHALTFDLREVLAALGPRGLTAYWTVGDVAAQGESLDATGEGAAALEELAMSYERIIGSRLAKIAESVRQVIWGEFKGYEDKLSDTPRVVVVAFDSSWWEIAKRQRFSTWLPKPLKASNEFDPGPLSKPLDFGHETAVSMS